MTFKHSSMLDEVLATIHNIDDKEVGIRSPRSRCIKFCGIKVDCKRAVPRDQASGEGGKDAGIYRTKKLFVGGLPQNLSEGRRLSASVLNSL